MKRILLGLAACAVMTPAFATFDTAEELGGPMTPEQVHGLTPDQLKYRSALIDLKVAQAQAKLKCSTTNFGKNGFKAPGTYADPCADLP